MPFKDVNSYIKSLLLDAVVLLMFPRGLETVLRQYGIIKQTEEV